MPCPKRIAHLIQEDKKKTAEVEVEDGWIANLNGEGAEQEMKKDTAKSKVADIMDIDDDEE